MKDCGGVICHVEKNYFKTKFSKRKQSFRGVLLKSILKLLVNSLKNIAVAGCQPVTLLKVNSFKDNFQEFC